jgi:hypothetical protein
MLLSQISILIAGLYALNKLTVIQNYLIISLPRNSSSIIEAHEDVYTFAEKEITKQNKLIQRSLIFTYYM